MRTKIIATASGSTFYQMGVPFEVCTLKRRLEVVVFLVSRFLISSPRNPSCCIEESLSVIPADHRQRFHYQIHHLRQAG